MPNTTHYTRNVGVKFFEDGSVRPFPGNTIICFCDPNSQAYASAAWVQEQLQAQPFASKFSLLPLSSMHMTVIQLLCDEFRVPGEWSTRLPLDAPLSETDDFFIEALKDVPAPPNFRMTFTHLWPGEGATVLSLKPADEATHEAIWAYREAVARATAVRFPNHDTYVFHMSIAYQVIQLDADEISLLEAFRKRVDAHLLETFGIFDTGAPHLTFFDDMFAFVKADERHTLKSRVGEA